MPDRSAALTLLADGRIDGIGRAVFCLGRFGRFWRERCAVTGKVSQHLIESPETQQQAGDNEDGHKVDRELAADVRGPTVLTSLFT